MQRSDLKLWTETALQHLRAASNPCIILCFWIIVTAACCVLSDIGLLCNMINRTQQHSRLLWLPCQLDYICCHIIIGSAFTMLCVSRLFCFGHWSISLLSYFPSLNALVHLWCQVFLVLTTYCSAEYCDHTSSKSCHQVSPVTVPCFAEWPSSWCHFCCRVIVNMEMDKMNCHLTVQCHCVGRTALVHLCECSEQYLIIFSPEVACWCLQSTDHWLRNFAYKLFKQVCHHNLHLSVCKDGAFLGLFEYGFSPWLGCHAHRMRGPAMLRAAQQ